jgi:hypothetical protein
MLWLDTIPTEPGAKVELGAKGAAIRLVSGVQDGMVVVVDEKGVELHAAYPGKVIATPFTKYAVVWPAAADPSVELVVESSDDLAALSDLSVPPLHSSLLFQGNGVNVAAGVLREIPIPAAVPFSAALVGATYPATESNRARLVWCTASSVAHSTYVCADLIGGTAADRVPVVLPETAVSVAPAGRVGAVVSCPYPPWGGVLCVRNTSGSLAAFDLLAWSTP